jgi:hypothetical protein
MRTEPLSFFSEEEVARARRYHRPLYWAAAADAAIEASVLAALVWSGAGAALDPGSLPWWGRTPAYAAIVVAASAAARAPPALWSPTNLTDLDPPRLLYLLLFTHPTPPERLAAAA